MVCEGEEEEDHLEGLLKVEDTGLASPLQDF